MQGYKLFSLSYPKVLKAMHMIEMVILAKIDSDVLLKGEIEFDENCSGGRRIGKISEGAFNKVPFFGILE